MEKVYKIWDKKDKCFIRGANKTNYIYILKPGVSRLKQVTEHLRFFDIDRYEVKTYKLVELI